MVMKKVVLDTNIVIEILRGNEAVMNQVSIYDSVCLPVTVCGELLFGAYNSSKIDSEIIKYHNFLATTEILEINIAVVENYALIRSKLKQKGRPIPENDIWIAAIAITNDIVLMSNDGHFSEIESLNFVHIKK